MNRQLQAAGTSIRPSLESFIMLTSFFCSPSGATAGISPQLSAVAKVEEQLGRTGMFGSGAQYSTVQPGVDTGLTLPPGLQLDPGADFTLIYAFLGSLFDGSRTDVDHWRVLAEV